MATYNLRRFSVPDGLKAIGRNHLINLLSPYRDFLSTRGITLPMTKETGDLNYEGLVSVFMTPDTDTPNGFADALYFIHEMATPEGMDELLDVVEHNPSVRLDDNPDPTAADVAVQVWLQDRELLERKHAEQYLIRPRSFEYFQANTLPLPAFKNPPRETLVALEKDLDDWFESKKRGRGCRVFVYPKKDGVWFLVRHGEPYKREGSIEKGQSSSVFYRPEKHDVLIYEPSMGELRMNARSKGEKDLYRKKLGLHLFADEDFFPGTAKYTLEPLKADGEASLVCTDVDSMEWVKLKEVRFFWGGAENEIEIRKADDIFAALKARNRTIPTTARISRAGFLLKFSDSKTPRTLNIRPSNIAEYARDDDSAIIENWLVRRGFIVTEKHEDNA